MSAADHVAEARARIDAAFDARATMTPGPWSAHDIAEALREVTRGDYYIRSAAQDGRNFPFTREDADVAAAAPDLLDEVARLRATVGEQAAELERLRSRRVERCMGCGGRGIVGRPFADTLPDTNVGQQCIGCKGAGFVLVDDPATGTSTGAVWEE